MPKNIRWTLLSGLILTLPTSCLAAGAPSYSLGQAVVDALALDPRTSAAQLELDASETDISIAEGGHYPSFTAQAGSRSEGFFEYNFNVTQKLYDWGRVSSQVDSSIASNNQNTEKLRQAVSETSNDIAKTYLDYQQAKDSSVVYRDYLTKLNQFLEVASLRAAKNFTGGEEIERVYLEHARASNILAGFEGQQQSARRDFMTLTGKDPDNSTLAPAPEFPLLKHYHDATSLNRAIEQSPSVKANLAEADKARAELELSKAKLLPQLNLEFDLRSREFNNRIVSDAIVAFRLRSDTYAGISNFLKPGAAQNRVESREYQMKASRRDLRRNLQQLASLQPTIENRMQALESQKKASERMMNIYQQQFLAGLKDFDSLLLVTRDHFDARRQQIQLRNELLATQYEVASNFGVFEQMLANSTINDELYPGAPAKLDKPGIFAKSTPQPALPQPPLQLAQVQETGAASFALESNERHATKLLVSDSVTLSDDAPLESADQVPIDYVEILPEQQAAISESKETMTAKTGLQTKILSFFGLGAKPAPIGSAEKQDAFDSFDNTESAFRKIASQDSDPVDYADAGVNPTETAESSFESAAHETNLPETASSQSSLHDMESSPPSSQSDESVQEPEAPSELAGADLSSVSEYVDVNANSAAITQEVDITDASETDDIDKPVETVKQVNTLAVDDSNIITASDSHSAIKSKIVFENASPSSHRTRIEYCSQDSCESLKSVAIIRETN